MSLMNQALSEVSMNKIALSVNIFAEDWTAEMVIIASNGTILLDRTIEGKIYLNQTKPEHDGPQ